MKVLDEGTAELLAWHDPDEQRKWVLENKPRSLIDKRTNLKDAIAKFVHDGDYIASGGFGHVRVSMAAIYEIIRQRKRNLTLAGKTAVHDADILISSGCVKRVEVAYCFGHELRGLSPASRRSVETGIVDVAAEISNAGFQWRFKAAAMGLPFIPTRVMLGTDTFKHSSAKLVKDPFSGKLVCLLPACYPDVVVLHVHRCDKYGNSQIDGIIIEDFELSRAARRLIITTEEIVGQERIRKEPWKTVVPFYLVDAIIEQPYGSHPGNMPYLYYSDEEHMYEWLKLSKTDEGAQQYFEKYVYDINDFEEYLRLIGGTKKLKHLRDLEHLRVPLRAPWAEGGIKMAEKTEYTTIELMACATSRTLEDRKSVLVGTGLPIIAAVLAQKTHAPNMLIVFEAGGLGPRVPMLPISVGDSRTFYEALMASSMDYVMSTAQMGYMDYGLLGAAQIDTYGNINTTVIGAHERPMVRLPGSGGANDAGSLCWKTIITMQQDARKFCEKIDFITTPGYLTGPGAREKAGLPTGTGPHRVITQLGIMGFDDNTKRMTLLSTHPGVSVEQVKASTGFELNMPEKVTITESPTSEELSILRRDIDPAGIVLKRR